MTDDNMWTRRRLPLAWGLVYVGVVTILCFNVGMRVAWAGTVRLLPRVDTFVASGQPNRAFASASGLWVGNDQAGGYGVERTLMQFDASALPAGSKFVSAQLWLHLGDATPDDTSMMIRAYRVRNDNWSGAINWSDHLKLSIDSTPAASTQVATSLGWYSWDLTSALQAWSDSRDTVLLSFILRSDVESGQHERGFWSMDCSNADCGTPPGKRPYLEINYELPTPTPTNTTTPTPTGSPTPTATPIARIEVQLGQTPQGGNKLAYEISYRNPTDYYAYSVVITDRIPANVSFVSASPGGTPVPSITHPST